MYSRFTNLGPYSRSSISALAAFVFYAFWGYLVNSMHGHKAAISAAIVQGCYSFMLTLMMALLLEMVYRGISKFSVSNQIAATATIIICCAVIFSTSWWVNKLAGTPEIFYTVILGYFIGALYSIVYVTALVRESRYLEID